MMFLKALYDKLVAKVENIDTSGFVLKVQLKRIKFRKENT